MRLISYQTQGSSNTHAVTGVEVCTRSSCRSRTAACCTSPLCTCGSTFPYLDYRLPMNCAEGGGSRRAGYLGRDDIREIDPDSKGEQSDSVQTMAGSVLDLARYRNRLLHLGWRCCWDGHISTLHVIHVHTFSRRPADPSSLLSDQTDAMAGLILIEYSQRLDRSRRVHASCEYVYTAILLFTNFQLTSVLGAQA